MDLKYLERLKQKRVSLRRLVLYFVLIKFDREHKVTIS